MLQILFLILFCSLSSLAFATPVYVQGNGNVQDAFAGTTPLTLSSSVTSGDTIMVMVNWQTGVTLSSVTDNCGGTYTFENNNTSASDSAMAYGTGSAGSCTITAAFSANFSGFSSVTAIEVKGVGAFDQSALQHVSTSGNGFVSGNVTTNFNGEYIFGCYGSIGGGGGTYTATTGSGFSLEYNDGQHLYTEDQVQSSTGSIEAEFTLASSSAGGNVGIMTFKPAAPTPSQSVIHGLSTIHGLSSIH